VSHFLLVIAVALTVGAIVFGIIVLVTGDDGGLSRAEPDGRAVPLPADRPLAEPDVTAVRFDMTVRGYRMAQVDSALGRLAYDIGYKDELIKVLQSEVDALREGRLPDAEVLRRAREAAAAPASYTPPAPETDIPGPEAAAVPPGEDAPQAEAESEATSPGPFR
jgi:DivIVA domain-containing protein